MNQDTFIFILFKYRETTLPLLNLTITLQQSGELRMCWSVPSWAEAELRYWHWPQWLRWQSGWRCELRLSPLFLLLEPPESLLQSLVLCNNLVQLLLQMLDLTVTGGFNVLTILEPIYCLSQDLVQNVFTLDCNSLEAEEIEGFVVCWRLHLCDPHPTPWRQPSLQLPAPSSSSAWVLSDEIEQLLFVMLYDLMCSFHNEWDLSSI